MAITEKEALERIATGEHLRAGDSIRIARYVLGQLSGREAEYISLFFLDRCSACDKLAFHHLSHEYFMSHSDPPLVIAHRCDGGRKLKHGIYRTFKTKEDWDRWNEKIASKELQFCSVCGSALLAVTPASVFEVRPPLIDFPERVRVPGLTRLECPNDCIPGYTE